MSAESLIEPGAPGQEGGIPLCVPNISGNEWRYVKECLDTGWVSSVGSFVDRFEAEFATAVGAKHAVATTSGTAALHVALMLAGVRPGNEVVVPALTFIAPANAVRYVGAWPVFLDVEPEFWQLDPVRLEEFLREGCHVHEGRVMNRATGRRVAAILPVDILGHPCDLMRIHEIATEFRLPVVEDATESLGARYRDRALGSWTALTCFSFNGNKLLTTGGGGMLTTWDEEVAERGRYLTRQAKDDALEFVHRNVGYNYRLSNVLAAIGCAQLERLGDFVELKRRIAERYAAGLGGINGVALMKEAPWAFSAFWLYTVLVDDSRVGLTSRDLVRELSAQEIQARPLWQPLHRSPAHQGSYSGSCGIAELLNRQAISLPSSTSMTEAQQARVVSAVREILRA